MKDALKNLKYGFFVHFVNGLTVNRDGSAPKDFESFANGFDAQAFADDLQRFGVEYVIITAAHYNQNFLFPCDAVKKWGMPDHCCSRDLLGDMTHAVRSRGIQVMLYTHPRDGHDFSPEDQKKTGWNATAEKVNPDPAVFERQKWNDFINDCYAEVVDRYGSEIVGLYLDEGSAAGDSYKVVDYPRLRATIKKNHPDLVMIQNYYGNLYSCDIGDKEYCYWGEFAQNDGSKWPCYRIPVASVMGSMWWASIPQGKNTVHFSPEDMFRYTVLEAGANIRGGGVQWAAGPYADGGWETGVAETMEKVGRLVNAVAPSVKNTVPSSSYPTPEGKTIADLPWGVATRSADGSTEYIHILKKPSGNTLELGVPADGCRFAEPFVLNPGLPLETRLVCRDGSYSLIFKGEFDRLDTVVGLKVISGPSSWKAMKMEAGPFNGVWESLQQFECPQWFRDAKFGVWAHWGPQCVPGFGDWYARNMYVEGSEAYRYHVQNYGHPSRFGYKDVVELWKAEKFDPDALMSLYRDMGAKYFVAMGVHHDNFDCWDSQYHSWNAVNHGPHRDIVGEWKNAAGKYGLRFGVSEHLERSWSWFATNKGCDTSGPFAGVPYDGCDSRYRELYLNNSLNDSDSAYPAAPDPAFVRNYYDRIADLVEHYSPDWLYSDGGVPFGRVGLQMIANFYNHNIYRHSGKMEAVYCYKDINRFFQELSHGEYRPGAGVLDLERTLSPEIRKDPWQTDTCIGNWFYKKGIVYKTAYTVIGQLCDVVSKNGCYLLSVPLRSDGTLDEQEKKIVADITEWMKVNSEAIYGTRPFSVFGEGPACSQEMKPYADTETPYTPEDFRFTAGKDAVYAVCMGRPESGSLRVTQACRYLGAIRDVKVLGSESTKWSAENGVLSVVWSGPSTAVGMPVVKIAADLKRD